MFNINHCKAILTAYLNQGWTVQSGSSSITNPAKGSGIVQTTGSSTRPLTPAEGGTLRETLPTGVYLGFGYGANLSINGSNQIVGFTEVTPTAGNSYRRVVLTANGLGNTKLLAAATTETQSAVINPDTASEQTIESHDVAVIKNTNEYIISDYTGDTSAEGAGWGNTPIDAFVIFSMQYSSDSQADNTAGALFYGKIEDPTNPGHGVSVPANVVPIILKDKFKVTLG